MKREDVVKLFPDATEEQVDAILNQVGSELNPLKERLAAAESGRDSAQSKLDAATAENEQLAAQNKEMSERLQEGMSADEKLQELLKQNEQASAELAMKSNALDARAIFAEAGIDGEQADALVSKVVSDNAEKTKGLAESIVAAMQAQREAVEQATKDALLNANPKPWGTGGEGAPVTKEAFDKLSYGEQQKLLEENPGLLQTFAKPSAFSLEPTN